MVHRTSSIISGGGEGCWIECYIVDINPNWRHRTTVYDSKFMCVSVDLARLQKVKCFLMSGGGGGGGW
jgi:hypothetical protein